MGEEYTGWSRGVVPDWHAVVSLVDAKLGVRGPTPPLKG